MPIKMGRTIQSVVIGDSVYFGGGDADSDRDRRTVMKLDLLEDEWTKLPPYSKGFAMTSLANWLVLVGGLDPMTQKQIAVFKSGQWTNPYPPMNVARHYPTAVCYNKHIIVAGGLGDFQVPTSVEVLDLALRKWYYSESLANPRSYLKSTVIGNTLYLMGGYTEAVVYEADLNELITNPVLASKQATPTLWQTIESTPQHFDSAPLNVGGSLLAVGGRGNHYNPVSSIHLYQPDTRRWVKVGDLPTARFNCTCSVLRSGEVIVAGGDTRQYEFINTIDFLSITDAH